MKTKFNLPRIKKGLIFFLFTTLFFSCQKESLDDQITISDVEKNTISNLLKEKLIENEIDPKMLSFSSFVSNDGTIKKTLSLGGDLYITEKEALKRLRLNVAKAYYNNNLFSNRQYTLYLSQNIKNLSDYERSIYETAIREGINFFNSLGLNISFRLKTKKTNNATRIRIGSGDFALFPEDNLPGELLQLDKNLHSFYATKEDWPENSPITHKRVHIDIIKATFLHELGHLVGLEHSDFLTEASCGKTLNPTERLKLKLAINSGDINHIAGTSESGNITNVLMAACYNAQGFYSDDTISGLRLLY